MSAEIETNRLLTQTEEQEQIVQPRKRLKRLLYYVGWLPLTLVFIAAQRLLAARPDLVERFHVNGVFYILSWPLIRFNSLFPFSLTELLVVIILPVLVVFLLIRSIIRLIKNPDNRAARFGRGLVEIAWTGTIFLVVFMLMHGFNYARLPAAEIFDLPVKERPAADLAQTAKWLTTEAAALREDLSEDDQGVFILGSSLKQTMLDVNTAYDRAEQDWPALSGHEIRPKGVILSHYWSDTAITGMYDPILAEANVNIDQPAYSLPDTIAHEVAHTRGFAREDEANFVAFLTGIYAENADYRYSVMMDTWIRITNRLYRADRDAYDQVAAGLTDAMRRDLAAGSVYWQQFEGPVQEVSNQANNLFLQANMQTDGVQSYGRMIDLVLAWYEKEQSGD